MASTLAIVIVFVFLVLLFKPIFTMLFGGIRFIEDPKERKNSCSTCGMELEKDDTFCPYCMEDRKC